MKIALVHDHLISQGGGEQLLKIFCELWPEAPIYTLIYDKESTSPVFEKKDIRTSYLQHLPLGIKRFRWFLPLRPRAIEQFVFDDYDVVLSNTSALIKGIITGPSTLHINYCNTPTRFLWINPSQRYDSLENIWPISVFSDWYKEHRLKDWDKRAAQRVDLFIANSKFAQDGIKRFYGADSTVIYPPVDTDKFFVANSIPKISEKGYFLVGGRLVPQKRYDIAIKAFNKLAMPLKIFGIGPELSRLKKMAGPTIEFLGRVSEDEKRKLLSNAQAFLYPQVEDFGITAVESMASGRPVIAYGAGGSLETVVNGKTGILYDHQDWESLACSVIRFMRASFDSISVREHAVRFSADRFRNEIKEFVKNAWEDFNH